MQYVLVRYRFADNTDYSVYSTETFGPFDNYSDALDAQVKLNQREQLRFDINPLVTVEEWLGE